MDLQRGQVFRDSGFTVLWVHFVSVRLLPQLEQLRANVRLQLLDETDKKGNELEL